jgi:D-proline reductase (dithiol) PrdB
MKPINYVACLNEMYQSQGFPAYRWSAFDTSPWTPFQQTLDRACIGLVSSAGIFREDQTPFDPWAVNDLSYRRIETDTPHEKLRLHHNYFDHRDAMQDLNCVFPAQRLAELEHDGVIGRFAPVAVTLGMGRLYKRTALQTETVPQIVAELKSQSVDAVLLVAAWPLDHQSVGLIARTIEESGISTVYIGACRDMMQQVRAPRSVFLNFPLGRPCGKPNQPKMQRDILTAALRFLESAAQPGEIMDLTHEWGESFGWSDFMKDMAEMLAAEGVETQKWRPKS